AGVLVECHDGCATATRCYDEMVVVDERRFAISPVRRVCSKLLRQVYRPDLFAGPLFETHQSSIGCLGEEPRAVKRGSSTRTVSPFFVVGLAGDRLPSLLAGGGVDGQDKFLTSTLSLRKQEPARDGERRIALAEALRLPHQRRSPLWPRFQQAGFRRG